jgi:hypothetical protein
MERQVIAAVGAFIALLIPACSGTGPSAPPASRGASAAVSPEVARRLGLPIPRSGIPGSGTAPSLLVPLYSYLGTEWTQLIAVKAAHPTAAVDAIVNPNNGPGTARDAQFASGIAALSAAGIGIYGYVYTSYGARALADVEADVDRYAAWYAPVGLFIDNVASVPGSETYYVALRAYAHARGITLTIGNAGTAVPASYAGAANALVVYEAAGWPATSDLANTGGGATEAFIALGVPFSSAQVAAGTTYARFFYATDRTGASSYTTLPSYIDTLVASVAR